MSRLFEPKNLMQIGVVYKWVEEMGISRSGTGMWIGMNDRSRTGTFKYNSSGKPIQLHNWQPDHPGAENDVAIMPSGKWITFGCKNERLFICELPLTE